jgi:hypothetical protein
VWTCPENHSDSAFAQLAQLDAAAGPDNQRIPGEETIVTRTLAEETCPACPGETLTRAIMHLKKGDEVTGRYCPCCSSVWGFRGVFGWLGHEPPNGTLECADVGNLRARPLGAGGSMAKVETDRRRVKRAPKLSATLESCGDDAEAGFVLAVWLESSRAVGGLRVLVREAQNNGGPLGFVRGQNGVTNDWPADLAVDGILPAWQSDALVPVAEWRQSLAPGDAAVWTMRLRRNCRLSAGIVAVRFKARAWPKDPAAKLWELPLPVLVTDRAREFIDGACKPR